MAWSQRIIVVLLLAELQMVVRADLACCAEACSQAKTERACLETVPTDKDCEATEYICVCEWANANTTEGAAVIGDSNATMICESVIIPRAEDGGQDMTLMLVGIFFGIAAGCGGVCGAVYCLCVKKEADKPDITPITIKTDEDGNAVIGGEQEIDYKKKKFEVKKRRRGSLDELRLPPAMSRGESEEFLRSRSRPGSRASSVRGSSAVPMLENGRTDQLMSPIHGNRSRGSSVAGRSDALMTPIGMTRAKSFNSSLSNMSSVPLSTVSGRSDAMSSMRKAGSFNGRSSALSASGRSASSARPMAGPSLFNDEDNGAKVFMSEQLDSSAMMFDLKEETRRAKNPNMTDEDFKKEDMAKEGEEAAKKMGLVRVKSWAAGGLGSKSPRESQVKVKQRAREIEAEEAAAKKKENDDLKKHAMALLGMQKETTEDLLATPGSVAAREILRAQAASKGPRHKALLGAAKDHRDTQLGLGERPDEITHERLNPADQIFEKMNRQAMLPVPMTPANIKRQLPAAPRIDSKVGYSHGDPGIDHLKIRTVGLEGTEGGDEVTEKVMAERADLQAAMTPRRDADDDQHDMDTTHNTIFRSRFSNQSQFSQVSDVGSLEGPAFDPDEDGDVSEDGNGSDDSNEFGRSQSAGSKGNKKGIMYEKEKPRTSGSFGKKGIIRGSFKESFKNTLALAGLSADESTETSRRNSRIASISSQNSGKFQTLADAP